MKNIALHYDQILEQTCANQANYIQFRAACLQEMHPTKVCKILWERLALDLG